MGLDAQAGRRTLGSYFPMKFPHWLVLGICSLIKLLVGQCLKHFVRLDHLIAVRNLQRTDYVYVSIRAWGPFVEN